MKEGALEVSDSNAHWQDIAIEVGLRRSYPIERDPS
jgi:hypothetical protein